MINREIAGNASRSDQRQVAFDDVDLAPIPVFEEGAAVPLLEFEPPRPLVFLEEVEC
jgi:hypothetical protein